MPKRNGNLEHRAGRPASPTWPGIGTLVLVIVLMASVDAHAYIDPGTGSYLFQLAIAGLLAGAYAVRRYWRAIRFRLDSLLGKSHPAAGAAQEDDHVR